MRVRFPPLAPYVESRNLFSARNFKPSFSCLKFREEEPRKVAANKFICPRGPVADSDEAPVAQWIEQKTSKLMAVGSIPTRGTKILFLKLKPEVCRTLPLPPVSDQFLYYGLTM